MLKNIEYQFRFCLFLWIIAANLAIQLLHIPFSWTIFISNIMLFTMAGDIKQNFLIVELGGATGLIFAFFSILFIDILAPLGTVSSVMLVLCIVLFCIIMFSPKFPYIFNNTTFAYFTCAFITSEPLITQTILYLVVFVIGSALVNLVSIKLFHKFFKI